MRFLKILGILTTAMAIAIGWTIYNISLPQDMEHRDVCRMAIATRKIVDFSLTIVGIFGFDRLYMSRYMMRFNSKLRRKETDEKEYKLMTLNGVRVRLYSPHNRNQKPSPAVVYIAGGGWIMLELDLYHIMMKNLSETTEFSVFVVEYRIAPEHKFPAAVNDCETVINYLLENAAEFNIDPRRIGVMGDSAGGNLAAVVGITMKQYLKFVMILNAPLQGLNLQLPSYKERDNLLTSADGSAYITLSYLLGIKPSQEMMELAKNNRLYSSSVWEKHGHKISTQLINQTEEPISSDIKGYSEELDELITNFKFSPLMADNLSGLPETYLFSCEYDVLRDDSYLYAARLKQAGVQIQHRNDKCFHAAMSIVHNHPIWDDFAKLLTEKL